jgi:hypothetical protein
MGVSYNGATHIFGWFMIRNPIEMDDLGVPLFQYGDVSIDVGMGQNLVPL